MCSAIRNAGVLHARVEPPPHTCGDIRVHVPDPRMNMAGTGLGELLGISTPPKVPPGGRFVRTKPGEQRSNPARQFKKRMMRELKLSGRQWVRLRKRLAKGRTTNDKQAAA